MEWTAWRESWQGWSSGLLVGSVVSYDRRELRVQSDGLRRFFVTGMFWRGYLGGEPVPGDHASPDEAMAAVDVAHDLAG